MNIAKPFVSIVTPFHNTAAYLSESIKSVLAQTYDNWEYVLVNNQSTDRSPEIARRYADTDERIRVVNTTRLLTQPQNYSYALEQISDRSKYCKIVQADDWLFPECLARMIEVAERDDSVGVVAGYRLQGRYVSNDGLPYSADIFAGRDVSRLNLLMDGRQLFGSPTTVLMRSEAVRSRKPFYPENSIFEDTDAIFEVLRSWNFGFVYQICAYERVDNDSTSSRFERFDPAWFLSKFLRVKRYGPEFLDGDEYAHRIQDIERAYMRFLARNVLSARGKAFWDFHRDGLMTVDYRLTRRKLAKYVGLEVLDLLLNPKATVGMLWRSLRMNQR